jgi:putative transposase
LNEKTTASSSTRSVRNSERRSAVVDPTMDAVEAFRKQLDGAGIDVLRELVKVFAERLMAEEAEVICGAGYGERSDERVNRRNGYRERTVDTRVGTIDLAIPRLRESSYFPGWLLEPRRRAERALVQVVAECYVKGVSTRRVDGLVKTLGIEHISKSRVSQMAKDLDQKVRPSATVHSTVAPTPTSGSMRWRSRSARRAGSKAVRRSWQPA